jgi:hypothetical protein
MSTTKAILFLIELETGQVLERFTGEVREGAYSYPDEALRGLNRPGTCLAAGLLYSDAKRDDPEPETVLRRRQVLMPDYDRKLKDWLS